MNKDIIKKVQISILTGLLSWIITYLVVMIPAPSDVLKFISAVIIFAILPLLFGTLLILFLKEHHYSAVLYCITSIIIFDIIDILRDIILLPEEYSVVKETLQRFQHVGLHSLLFAILGGLIGLRINNRRQSNDKKISIKVSG